MEGYGNTIFVVLYAVTTLAGIIQVFRQPPALAERKLVWALIPFIPLLGPLACFAIYDPAPQKSRKERKASGDRRSKWDGVGRNDPCPCGSGEKFKRCCLEKKRSA